MNKLSLISHFPRWQKGMKKQNKRNSVEPFVCVGRAVSRA